MYLMMTSVYPSDKDKELVEKYIEILGKYPPDDNLYTEVVPLAVKRTEKGVKTINVVEVKPGKLEETLIRYTTAMVICNDIEGFEYTIDAYLTAGEAMSTIGMSVPG